MDATLPKMVKHTAKKGEPVFAPISTAQTLGSTDFGFVSDLLQKDGLCQMKCMVFWLLLLISSLAKDGDFAPKPRWPGYRG